MGFDFGEFHVGKAAVLHVDDIDESDFADIVEQSAFGDEMEYFLFLGDDLFLGFRIKHAEEIAWIEVQ